MLSKSIRRVKVTKTHCYERGKRMLNLGKYWGTEYAVDPRQDQPNRQFGKYDARFCQSSQAVTLPAKVQKTLT